MSWLVRMELDAQVISNLRIRDSYDWHQRIWECFPEAPDHTRDFLTRIDPKESHSLVWILALRKPILPDWCPPNSIAAKELSPTFLSHHAYVFDLRVNPTKSLVQRNQDGTPCLRPNGKRASGKRVPLVDPIDLRSWIDRKGAEGGFKISDSAPLEIGPMVESHFRKSNFAGYHGGVQFRGALEVTDSEKFVETYHKGIGSAKGFGFGLLLLSPLHH